MYFSKSSKFIIILGMISFRSAYATNYGIKAERLDSQGSSVGAPDSFFSDATQVKQAFWLPDQEVKKIVALMTDKGDPKSKVTKLTQIFCNGTKARLKPRFDILLIPPQYPVGTPIDEAAKKRAAFVRTAKGYLQSKFLYEASKDLTQKLPDGYILSLFPSAVGSDERSIVNFYKNLRIDPELPKEELSEFEVTPEDSFFLIGIPGKDRMLMVPKVARSVIVTDTPDHKKQPRIETVTFGGITGRMNGQLFNSSAAIYVPSFSWRFNESKEQLTVLQPSFFVDLGILRKTYTFLFPQKVQKDIFHFDYQRFVGLSYEGHASPSRAIEQQDLSWRIYLKFFSELTSTRNEDGTTDIGLKIDFQPFCEFNRALPELMVN